MNQYGDQALRHWQEYLPQRYATLPDPNSFFSTLGEQAASQIEARTIELAGPDPQGEGFLAKLGRLNEARMRAEEEILQELILIDPETDDPEQQTDENPSEPPPSGQWVPLIEDPTHPAWQQIAEEEAAMSNEDDPTNR